MKPVTKPCSSCHAALPLSAFNRAGASRDGRAAICRRCLSLARRSARPQRKSDSIRAAIKQGDARKTRALFSHSSKSPNELLSIAVQDYNTARKRAGHVQIVDFLIAQGATPHWYLLFEPARTGSQEIVDRLIAYGAERNIFTCAVTGDVTGTAKLLRRDSELSIARTGPEVRRYRDFTPLHFCCLSALGRRAAAVEKRLLDTARLLIEHGADVNAIGCFYGGLTVTPLDMAAHTGGNVPLIEFLIAGGAAISSFCFLEALSHRGRSLAEGLAVAELFLRSGFQINSPHEDGTVLHRAANTGAADVVDWLLKRGADVHARGRQGRTPLHMAAERNRLPRVVQLLLKCGARVNAVDDHGLTPLDVARQHGRTTLLAWLKGDSAST